jgi:hypothetical protein
VAQDAMDHLGLLDRRDQAHPAPTARAGQHVEAERAAHQIRPEPAAAATGFVRRGLGILRGDRCRP